MSQQDRQPLKQPDEAPPAYSPQQPGYGAAPPPNYPANGGYVAPGYQSGAPPGYQPMPGQTGPYTAQPGPYGGQPGPYGGQPVTVTTTNVVVVGGCPACRVGILEDDFTLLGVCCAILFFPLGILCCLAMRQRRCPNCGAVFG